jgi:hypothetical protein
MRRSVTGAQATGGRHAKVVDIGTGQTVFSVAPLGFYPHPPFERDEHGHMLPWYEYVDGGVLGPDWNCFCARVVKPLIAAHSQS